jgi:hypothetical protein
LGTSSSGTPPQTAGSFSKLVGEDYLKYVAFKVDRLHLAETKCLEMPEGSLKIQAQPR